MSKIAHRHTCARCGLWVNQRGVYIKLKSKRVGIGWICLACGFIELDNKPWLKF